MRTPTCYSVGFGPGIGLALARVFCREESELAPASRPPRRHSVPLNTLEHEGLSARSFAADASSRGSFRAARDQARDHLGGAQVLTGIHVATEAIAGHVQSETHGNPANIAEQFVRHHQQTPEDVQTEIINQQPN